MKRKEPILVAAALLAIAGSSVMLLNNVGGRLLKAVPTSTHYCADIVFGTTQYTSNSGVATSDFTTTNMTVNSVDSTYCYAVSGSAARIGKSSTQGILTFNFDSCVITRAQVVCYKYSTDASKDATFSLATSAYSSDNFKSVTETSASSLTTYTLDFTNLDNGSGAASTSLTVKSTNTARISLCKILLTISGSAPNGDYIVDDDGSSSSSSSQASSSSSSASSTPSSSSSSSSSTPTYNPAITVSASSVTMKVGDSASSVTVGYSGYPSTPTISASSSATSVANVSVSGTTVSITAVSNGTATITVTGTSGSYSASKTISVTIYNPQLTLSESSATLTVGGSNKQITATATGFPASATITASSNNSGICSTTVSGSYVTLKPVAAGSATVTITATNGGYSVSKTVSVTVNAASGTPKTLKFMVKEILAGQYCDSIYFRYGPLSDGSYYDCLVDGGNSQDSDTCATLLSTYCTDHKLDMYIGTHSHDDHLGVWKSKTASNNLLVSGGITSMGYVVDCGSARSVAFYTNYVNVIRPYMTGTLGATYIPVHAFFNDDSGYTSWKGKNVFTIDSNVSLTFLNTNQYLTPGATTDNDPNRTSVSTLLSAWDQRYIFCGDGDEYTQNGIISNYSDSSGNPNLWSSSNDVYLKANHHGSNTNGSNSQTWIDWVNPDHVFVSAAIKSSNSSSSGVTVEQHPYVAPIQRFEKATYDIRWNGINGTFSWNSTDGSTPTFSGSAKTVPYYYNGSIVSGEETTTFPMSKWCLSSIYSDCKKTSATGHDRIRFSNYDVSWLSGNKAMEETSEKLKNAKPDTNEHGEIYDSMTDSYC